MRKITFYFKEPKENTFFDSLEFIANNSVLEISNNVFETFTSNSMNGEKFECNFRHPMVKANGLIIPEEITESDDFIDRCLTGRDDSTKIIAWLLSDNVINETAKIRIEYSNGIVEKTKCLIKSI